MVIGLALALALGTQGCRGFRGRGENASPSPDCGTQSPTLKALEADMAANGSSYEKLMRQGALLEDQGCLEKALKAYRSAAKKGSFNPELDLKIRALEKRLK